MPRSTNTVIDQRVRLNGVVVPATSWSVEVNAYSISSSIEATITTDSARRFAALPDLFSIGQKVRPLPIAIDLGFGVDAMPTSRLPLESGYIDEIERDHDPDARSVTLTGRGGAALFQDVQITAPLLRNSSGSAIIQKIFANRNVPLSVVSASPQYAGQTNNTQTFDQTMRGRTEWDVMQAIAVNDGYRLTLHNNAGTYGPYGTGQDPVLKAAFGQPRSGLKLAGLTIKQSPGRSHNTKIIARSYLPRSKRSIMATYGQSSAKDGETFQVAATPGLTSLQLKAQVQKIYEDIAKREFVATMRIIPDAALLQTVSKYGANFSIALDGPTLWPSERLTYEVRQIRFEFSPNGRGLPLIANVVAGNLNPIQTGGFLS